MEENNNLGEFSNFMLYSSGESKVSVQVLIDKSHNTIWATQKSMAQLFDAGVPAISKHLKNIFEEGELVADSVISKMETTASDGKKYDTAFYNLDAIIRIGLSVWICSLISTNTLYLQMLVRVVVRLQSVLQRQSIVSSVLSKTESISLTTIS